MSKHSKAYNVEWRFNSATYKRAISFSNTQSHDTSFFTEAIEFSDARAISNTNITA
jgi:hypothetical protein